MCKLKKVRKAVLTVLLIACSSSALIACGRADANKNTVEEVSAEAAALEQKSAAASEQKSAAALGQKSAETSAVSAETGAAAELQYDSGEFMPPSQGDTCSFAGLEWTVLDVCAAKELKADAEDGKTACLLFLNKDIGPLPYNGEFAVVSWETCSLREYLNTDFTEEILSKEDPERVLTVTVSNAPCSYLGTKVSRGGNDTEDRCFALSASEADRYSKYIDTALGREGYYSSFWLRTSMEDGADYGALMYCEGSVYEDMNPVTYASGVHPAVWVLYGGTGS